MADRYQDRPYSAADDKDESDPLAELARLIGQTDPFGTAGRANQKAQPRSAPVPDPYQQPAEIDDGPPAGPPPWMQRANRQEIKKPVYDEPEPEQDYQPNPVHPLHRYAAQHQHAAPQQDYEQQQYDEAEGEADPSRYDDALYGQIESGAQDYQREPAYPDDPYAYQDGDEDGADDRGEKRRGGVVMVIAVLALAVIGTGAAFAYRSYVGSPRSGDPPIIRADNSPTKMVPSPSDSANKTPDRMPAGGDGTEKIVPREEAPVDINGRAGSGPRVVFPPLNQNGNPPSVASVAPNNAPLASAGSVPTNGTMPNNEPRKIKTFSVRGDQPDLGAPVAAAPPPGTKAAPAPKTATRTTPPSSANASANAPLSLAPQAAPADPAPAADTRTGVAATNPVQTAPPASTGGSGGYVVQVSSQRSEADAQASFKALQSKFPNVLGSQSPLIKRADLGEKGVYYRAMVGPFGSADEASQLCGNLKSAGGQCVVQKN
jgi:SPOR domain